MVADSYRTEGQIGPIGALTVNKGFSRLKPAPVPVDDPALAAGDAFAGLLRARGVAVSGAVPAGQGARRARPRWPRSSRPR